MQAPPEVRDALTVLASDPANCDSLEQRWRWLNSVYLLASKTTPFLTRRDGEPLWDKVQNSRCRAALQPGEATWLALLGSLARADDAGIAANGAKLFGEPPAGLNGKQLIEALIATSGAQAMAGQSDAARALLGVYVPMLSNAGDYALALRLVESLAQSGQRH